MLRPRSAISVASDSVLGRRPSAAVSRRLRPVRSRKTSSRVGRATSIRGRGYAVRGQVGEQLADHRGAVLDPQVDGVVVDVDAGRRAPARAGPRRARRRPGRRTPSRDQVAEPALEPGGGVVGDHAAVVDHDHPAGEGVGLLEVVGGEHDGAAALGVQAPDQLLEVGPVLRVEPGRGLVEEQHPRHVHQPHRDVEAAPLAAGERGDLAVGDRGEVEVLDQLGGPRGAPRRRDSPWARPWLISSSRPSWRCPAPLPWPTKPIARRTSRWPVTTSCPATLAVPEVGGIRVVSMRSVVDFPAPLGPRKATSSPCPISRSRPLDGLDGLLARGEVAGQATGHDRRSGVVCGGS